MRKLSLILLITIVSMTGAFAQIFEPVKWSFVAKKLDNNEAVLFLKATIDEGWHIYSQNVDDGGPIKTSFKFTKGGDFDLVGKTVEPKAKVKFEDVFGMDVAFFNNEVVFQQRIKLKKGQTVVRGMVEFMACDAEQCLPPDEVAFAIQVK